MKHIKGSDVNGQNKRNIFLMYLFTTDLVVGNQEVDVIAKYDLVNVKLNGKCMHGVDALKRERK